MMCARELKHQMHSMLHDGRLDITLGGEVDKCTQSMLRGVRVSCVLQNSQQSFHRPQLAKRSVINHIATGNETTQA